MANRKKTIGSFKSELLKKSREAALTAVQIFNNPNIMFKSETYIVLMIISWTYLLHAYYRSKKIEYRYCKKIGKRKFFDKTSHGSKKYWDLERCLNDENCPLDKNVSNNLRFLIGLRHEIEHQLTTRLDEILTARYQACSLNYNECIQKLFGKKLGIEQYLAFSIQFSSISEEQKSMLIDYPDLPERIRFFIKSFDEGLTDEEYNNPKYAYRLLYIAKLVNHKGQADRVIEFIRSDSPLAESVNKELIVIRETDKQKFSPTQIVNMVQKEGYSKFSMHSHTQLWKSLNAKDSKKNLGVMVAQKEWFWFNSWLDLVLKHCKENKKKYT
jgi:hypothetical protein